MLSRPRKAASFCLACGVRGLSPLPEDPGPSHGRFRQSPFGRHPRDDGYLLEPHLLPMRQDGLTHVPGGAGCAGADIRSSAWLAGAVNEYSLSRVERARSAESS